MKLKIKKLIPYLVIIITGFILYSQIFFNSGFLTKSDNPVHIAETYHLATKSLPEYKWHTSWYPYEFAGIPSQMYYYQLSIWLAALLFLIIKNLFLAYKIALFLAYILTPLTLFFVLNKRFDTVIAFVSAFAFLFQLDYNKQLLAGMWGHAIGLTLSIILIHYLTKTKLNFKKSSALGILFALIILSHPFLAIMASYILLISLLITPIKEKGLKKYNLLNHVWIFVSGSLISLFYLYPFIETREWMVKGVGWGLSDNSFTMLYNLFGIFFSLKPHTVIFDSISEGIITTSKEFLISILKNIPMLTINVLALVGLIIYIKNKKQNNKYFFDFILIFTLFSLILGSGFWFLTSLGRSIPFINSILSYRFVYYSRIGLFCFAALGLREMYHNGFTNSFLSRKKIKIIAISILLLFMLSFLAGLYQPPESYTQTSSQAPLMKETFEVWEWIKNNLDNSKYRILNQNFFDNIDEPLITKDSAAPALAHYYSGFSFIGAWVTWTVYPTEQLTNTENKQLFGKRIENIRDPEIRENMEAYNIKYILAVSPLLKEKLTNSDIFKTTKSFGNYTIFELKKYNPEWISYEGDLDYEIKEFKDQEIEIWFDSPNEKAISIKMSYHPYWKAHVDGKEVEIKQNKYKLIEILLPEGEHTLKIQFEPKKPIYIIISLLTLLFNLGVIFIKK